jgi:hypothetical protein
MPVLFPLQSLGFENRKLRSCSDVAQAVENACAMVWSDAYVNNFGNAAGFLLPLRNLHGECPWHL